MAKGFKVIIVLFGIFVFVNILLAIPSIIGLVKGPDLDRETELIVELERYLAKREIQSEDGKDGGNVQKVINKITGKSSEDSINNLNTESLDAQEDHNGAIRTGSINVPIANISYYPVTNEMRMLDVDCSSKSFIPEEVRNNSVICQNIYTTDISSLKEKIKQSSKDRLVFHGQFSYMDCPLNLNTDEDIVSRCYEAAKFIDNWEIQKVSSLLGFPLPRQRVYIYFADSSSELRSLCGSGASACFKKDNLIVTKIINNLPTLFHRAESTTDFTFSLGSGNEIVYSLAETVPSGCYDSNTHELLHFINHQYWGGPITLWMDETVTNLIEFKFIENELCPPGPEYSRVVKSVNGHNSKVTDFSFATINKYQPLVANLDYFAENYQCRKGIIMQFTRFLDELGYGFIKDYYEEFLVMRTSRDSDYAYSLWKSTGERDEIKRFLNEQGCDF